MNQVPVAASVRLRTARRRWAVAAAMVFLGGLALVLLFMLTTATDNRALYEANYTRLLALNVGVAGILAGMIVWAIVRLVLRLRQGKFGSQLLVKIAVVFALVGVVPGSLIYGVSYQFVSRSIESWFDVRVESALNAGVSLGRTAIETLVADLSTKVVLAAEGLGVQSTASSTLAVSRLREQFGASDVQLWSAEGRLLASAGESRFVLQPQPPTAAVLKTLRTERLLVLTEGLDDPGAVQTDKGEASSAPVQARVRVWTRVNSPGFGLAQQQRYLQVVQSLPSALVANALAVQQANREYQERALARGGLRRMYIGTLTLALFLAVFASVLMAAVLGNQLIRPLLLLAEGVRDVTRGDLTPKLSMVTRDELGGLTRAFADMTDQLADAKAAVDHSMAQVNAAHANLQTILDNLTAGVVVLDEAGCIEAINPGATRILRAPLAAYLHRPLQEVPDLGVLAQGVLQQFAQLGADQAPLSVGETQLGVWQQSFEWGTGVEGPFQDGITIVARGAWLPERKRLLVFDDVSEMVSAQRAKAWGEVARRMAHEIKNPLTPIQLSAERLAMKLDGKLDPAGQALLTKSIKTIVDQVDAMKRLVNEFRDYARLPAAVLVPTDINATVLDVLALYDQACVSVRADLEPGCPLVAGDAAQIRQVIHNLVQNAQEAMGGSQAGEVCVTTRLGKTGQSVRLTVLDQGPGFADNILKRAFEPYVTTKARGTGLGLAVVKKIADDHGARVQLSNHVVSGRVAGGQVTVSFTVAI